MSLYDDIIAGGFDLSPAGRDDGAIAAALSVGRTRTKAVEVGNGMILETIGLTAGNALLDALYGSADFRHVKPLLEQGRLRLDSPMVATALDGLVQANVITLTEKMALLALTVEPDPVSAYDVANALEGK
jgi:hypothetical protein